MNESSRSTLLSTPSSAKPRLVASPLSMTDDNAQSSSNSRNGSVSPSKSPVMSQTKQEYSGFLVGFAEDRNKRCRRSMEDAHSSIPQFQDKPGHGFFAIFDGHAGRAAADWCGENLHVIFGECLDSSPTIHPCEAFNTSFTETDRLLAEKKELHSGCTAIVAYVCMEPDFKRLYTANVGDARAILCRGGKAIRLSFDHKGSDPGEQYRISQAGGFIINNRVNGILAVTRSLGDVSMKELIIGNPYTTETSLTNEDEFLILACDGIWDVCSDEQAVEMIRSEQDPEKAAERLLQFALNNYSTDNLSVLIIRFQH